MTTNDKPIITDSPTALHEYLVRLAMEAHAAASKPRCRAHIPGHHSAECALPAGHDGDHDDSIQWIEAVFCERMAPAAQTIVAEVEELREEAAQWHRKAQQTDDVRLREALQEREAMQHERDAIAAQLAALREAAQHVRWGLDPDEPQPDHAPESSGGGWGDVVAALDRALADTAAAEAHDREVRARVWEAADALLEREGAGRVYHERLLRARAAEERGGR